MGKVKSQGGNPDNVINLTRNYTTNSTDDASKRMFQYVENEPQATRGTEEKQAYRMACKSLVGFACSMDNTLKALTTWNNKNPKPIAYKGLELICKNAQKYGSGVKGSKNKPIELATDSIKPQDQNGKKVFNLAELPVMEYEAIREDQAQKLGVKPDRLDKLVEKTRKDLAKIKKAEPQRASVANMLANYYEITHTLDYWSIEDAARVSLACLRKSNPSCFGLYDKHPARKSIKASDIVFKPEGGLIGNQVNTFTGLNVTPDDRTPTKILDLLFCLCNQDLELYHHVLCWLALPLQKLGTKMDTALVFTSIQGTGKSLFFDKCYGEIFKGWYAKIKQIELEGRFNGWEAQKLFLFADEIEAKHGRNDVANHIKTRITSDTVIIEKKGVDQYQENARANFVFCSNEITPVKIEKGDRRFTSIRTRIKQEKEFYNEVADEVKDNGSGRLYSYLMAYDIGDFTANALPYETEDKQDQVEMFLTPHQEFIQKWTQDDPDTGVRFNTIKAKSLYEAFRVYCEDTGHSRPVSMKKFGLEIKREYSDVIKKVKQPGGYYYVPCFLGKS